MVWSYIGELIFNMLILVGSVKMSDHVVAGNDGVVRRIRMKRFYMFKDGTQKGSTETKRGGGRDDPPVAEPRNPSLSTLGFSVIEGEEEFIPYPSRQKPFRKKRRDGTVSIRRNLFWKLKSTVRSVITRRVCFRAVPAAARFFLPWR